MELYEDSRGRPRYRNILLTFNTIAVLLAVSSLITMAIPYVKAVQQDHGPISAEMLRVHPVSTLIKCFMGTCTLVIVTGLQGITTAAHKPLWKFLLTHLTLDVLSVTLASSMVALSVVVVPPFLDKEVGDPQQYINGRYIMQNLLTKIKIATYIPSVIFLIIAVVQIVDILFCIGHIRQRLRKYRATHAKSSDDTDFNSNHLASPTSLPRKDMWLWRQNGRSPNDNTQEKLRISVSLESSDHRSLSNSSSSPSSTTIPWISKSDSFLGEYDLADGNGHLPPFPLDLSIENNTCCPLVCREPTNHAPFNKFNMNVAPVAAPGTLFERNLTTPTIGQNLQTVQNGCQPCLHLSATLSDCQDPDYDNMNIIFSSTPVDNSAQLPLQAPDILTPISLFLYRQSSSDETYQSSIFDSTQGTERIRKLGEGPDISRETIPRKVHFVSPLVHEDIASGSVAVSEKTSPVKGREKFRLKRSKYPEKVDETEFYLPTGYIDSPETSV